MNPNNYLVCKPVGEHEIEIESKIYTVLFDQYNSFGFSDTKVDLCPPHYFQEENDIDKLKHEIKKTLILDFSDILFDTSGSLSIEHAIHYSQIYTKKKQTLIFKGCYHGSTAAIKKLGEDALLLPHSVADALVNVPECSYESSIIEISVRLATSRYSCILIDPNFCDHFIEVPRWYWEQLRELCDKWGTLLVFDEMRTGFRSEQMWFVNQLPITVDILVGAKALSNGLPFSFMGINERVYERDHFCTVNDRCTGFSYNPFIVSNACNVIKRLRDLYQEPDNIPTVFRNVAQLHVQEHIAITPRGYGLIIAINTTRPVLVTALCEAKLRKEGILVYRSENKFILYPHFNMCIKQLDSILSTFINIIKTVVLQNNK